MGTGARLAGSSPPKPPPFPRPRRADSEDLEVVAGGCQNLRELCVEGNPVAKVRKFRENIIASGERLQLIDNHRVTDREREFILRLKIRALKRTP